MLLFWFQLWKTAGATRVKRAKPRKIRAMGRSRMAMKTKMKNRGDGGNDDLGKVLAEEGLQALDAIAEGEDDAAGATLVEVTRAKG